MRSLTHVLYEHIRESSDRDLTCKTVFLLALASAKRVGELRRLSFKIKHSRGWGSVMLHFVLEFIAKTQNPSVPDARFESFTIPSLKDFVANDPYEILLCPVKSAVVLS